MAASSATHVDVANVSNVGLRRIAEEKDRVLMGLQQQYRELLLKDQIYKDLKNRIENLEKLITENLDGVLKIRSATLWGLSQAVRDTCSRTRFEEQKQRNVLDKKLNWEGSILDTYEPPAQHVKDVDGTSYVLPLATTDDMVHQKVRQNEIDEPPSFQTDDHIAYGPTFAALYSHHPATESFVAREKYSRIFVDGMQPREGLWNQLS